MAIACRRSGSTAGEPGVNAAKNAGATAASARPVDHLAPGELAEGSQEAFSLKLPRDLHIDRTFAGAVYASGPLSVHPLVQYFRARLAEGSLREGPTSAMFEHVKVPGKPAVELSLRVMSAPGGSRVEIVDATPPPMPNLPDEAARWRHVGLTPDGKLADPKHLE